MNLTRRMRLFSTLLAACLIAGAGAARAEGMPAKFSGDRLPEPPRQREPWSAPETGLPPAFVAATKALFDLGLADPRGCEYREVDVTVHSLSGGGYTKATRGWVLPEEGPGGRFVVAWDGLVYPASRVGKPADIAADVLRALEDDEADLTEAGKHDWRHHFRTFSPVGAITESDAVSHQSVLPLRACLLLRLGEEELASKLWDRWAAGLDEVNNNAEYVVKPYIVLAENWTWHQFDRALCAHLGGDDRIALLTARALAKAQGPAAAMAETLGAQRYTTEAVRGTVRVEGGTVTRHFETYDGKVKRPLFVTEHPGLRALLADQERRAVEPAAPNGLAEGPARVAALIRDLQEISVPQNGQPGYPDLGESPTVKALIAMGDLAVEPLLEAFEKDHRLTRTVSYHRDFSTGRSLLGVSQAAHLALAGILDDEPFEAAAPDPKLEGKARLLAGARACWSRAKGMPIEVRWQRALADDAASPDRWLRAAGHLVEPSAAGVARGEPLRAEAGPAIAALMARRVGDMERRPEARDNLPGWSTRMALILARWDPKSAVPALRARMARLRDELANPPPKPKPDAKPKKFEDIDFPLPAEERGESIALLTLERVRCGAPEALADYADWLRKTPPATIAWSLPKSLAPLWFHPGDPAISAATDALFGDPQSPWTTGTGGVSNGLSGLVTSPMLSLATFRTRVLEGLTDKSRAGVLSLTAGGVSARERAAGPWFAQMHIKLDSGEGRGNMAMVREPLGFELGAEIPFRACDELASRLSWIVGFPRCELFWPEARRDEAITACSALLRRYGAQFLPDEEAGRDPHDPNIDMRARLTLPKLDRPATPDDVERGRAIFSLAGEGDGEARVVPLPSRPTRASKDHEGEKVSVLIWQAEEVKIDGAWRRFYGIVGPGTIARIPAEQVELEPEADRGSGPPG